MHILHPAYGGMEAASEQAQGIDRVNGAVGQIDKVVEQNVAYAKHCVSASIEMNVQAGRIKEFARGMIILVGAAKGITCLDTGGLTEAGASLLKNRCKLGKAANV